MADLFWAFENPAVRDAGALPPVQLGLDYGTRPAPTPKDLQRAAALGRPVTPADCGPIRVISRYGFMIRCPGRVVLQRAEHRRTERLFTNELAAYGVAEIRGDRWPIGDTGFIASWISGSEYVKIQTGVMLFFPRDMYLYQGPLPNAQLVDGLDVEVMAGLEYPSKDRLWPDHDGDLAWASINAIVRIPQPGQIIELAAGDPLCWVFPVSARSEFQLSKLPLPSQDLAKAPAGAP
ncbi:hypothetical protein AB0M46_05360 [Dactylosporangium sp. NPDC051485]|uniref:hypothetical protein n=1 Tax=Dactylosporangium sp. NPDC051485 TaxID=3154846 RepID=UPI0034205A6D